MNTEFLEYVIARVSAANCQSTEQLESAIKQALEDRLNEAVRLVQDFDMNPSFKNLLKSVAHYHTVTLRNREENVPALLRPQV